MRNLFVALVVLTTPACGNDYCYSSDKNPYKLMGCRTDYSILPHQPLTKIKTTPEYGHCRPVMVWMVAKHGASWPSMVAMEYYFSLLPNVKQLVEQQIESNSTNLCKKDQKLFKSWKPKATEDKMGLHPTGEKGVKEFAKRMKKAFPSVFLKPFSQHNYIVQYGKTAWLPLYDSANAFIQSIFGRQLLYDYPQMFDLVEDMQKCSSDNSHISREGLDVDDSNNNLPLQKSFQAVRERLGNLELDENEINAAFFACAAETAWKPKSKSSWCALLWPDDIKAQEYADDIEFYYSSVYQDTFNKQAACPFIKDMIERFRLYKENPTAQHPRGIFYFGLGKHLNLVVTSLGLMYEKNNLNLDQINTARKFRSSHFLGYQSNLIVVLHECRTKQPPIQKTFRLKLFLNELLIGEVDLDTFINQYSQDIYSDNCNYDFCNQDVEARKNYRSTNPNPLGVNLDQIVSSEAKENSPFSSSGEGLKRVIKGVKYVKWYWWILIAPVVMLCSFVSLTAIVL